MAFSRHPEVSTSLLQLGVDRAEQRGDGRAHRLIADEHHDCDGGHDQRVLSHRLSLLKLPSLHKHSDDLVHCPVSSFSLLIGRNWPLSPLIDSIYSSLRSAGPRRQSSPFPRRRTRASLVTTFTVSRRDVS